MSEAEVIHLAVADRDPPGTCLRCGIALIPEGPFANLYASNERDLTVRVGYAGYRACTPADGPSAPLPQPQPRASAEEHAAIDEAAAVATRYDAKIAALRGKRIRVLRAVIYEGEAEAVFAQLARSLAPGRHPRCGAYGRRRDDADGVDITVIDDGSIKVLP